MRSPLRSFEEQQRGRNPAFARFAKQEQEACADLDRLRVSYPSARYFAWLDFQNYASVAVANVLGGP